MKTKNATPLLHERTSTALTGFIENPSHAILIHGPPGANYKEAAQWFCDKVVQQYDIHNSAVFVLESAKDTIGIDTIKPLSQFIKHRPNQQSVVSRIILVQSAHTMTTEAQTAVLKILEEPPSDVLFILSTDSVSSILDTIKSRVQSVQIFPLGLDAYQQAYPDQTEGALKRAFMLSRGHAAYFLYFLKNEEPVELEKAKRLLAAKKYERLADIRDYAGDRTKTLSVLESLESLLGIVLGQAAAANDRKKAAKLSSMLLEVEKAHRLIYRNGNIKLILTNLFIRL